MGRVGSVSAGGTCRVLRIWPIVLLCLLAAILAGCMQDEGERTPAESSESSPESGKRTLARLAECRGEYRDSDVPVRCENEIDRLEPLTGFSGQGADCVAEATDDEEQKGLRVHWNRSNEQHTLDYWSPYNITVEGIIGLTPADSDDVQYMNWNQGDKNATYRLPVFAPGDRIDLLMFIVPFETDTPQLEDAQAQVHWSLHEGSAYPIRMFVTQNETYYLPQARHMPDDDVFPYQWGPIDPGSNYSLDTMRADGADYSITVHHFQLFRETFTVPEPGDADC